MNDAAISPDVHAFLKDHVESYEELQILLLLSAQPERSWSCAEHCHGEHRVAILKLVTARAIERSRRGASLSFRNERFPRRKTDSD